MMVLAATAACGDDETDPGGQEELEVITTVNLTLSAAGSMLIGTFRDIDGPGGTPSMTTNPNPLERNTTYMASLEILNETESPIEDVTMEIQEEAEEHQVFYEASSSFLTVMITDTEMDYTMNMEGQNLPVGLRATITSSGAGTGDLRVVLKHLPPIGGMPQKTGSNGINDGETDFDVTFSLTVQ